MLQTNLQGPQKGMKHDVLTLKIVMRCGLPPGSC
jgi:hypothetical protein